MDMGDDFNRMGYMVEDKERIGQHKHRFRQAQGVAFGGGQLLKVPCDFIAQVAHHPPVKARQPLHMNGLIFLKLFFN